MVKKYSDDPKNIAAQADKTKTKYTKALSKTKGDVIIDGGRRAGSTKPDQN